MSLGKMATFRKDPKRTERKGHLLAVHHEADRVSPSVLKGDLGNTT